MKICFIYGPPESKKKEAAKKLALINNGLYWETNLFSSNKNSKITNLLNREGDRYYLYKIQVAWMEYFDSRINELFKKIKTKEIKNKKVYVNCGAEQLLCFLDIYKFKDLYSYWDRKCEEYYTIINKIKCKTKHILINPSITELYSNLLKNNTFKDEEEIWEKLELIEKIKNALFKKIKTKKIYCYRTSIFF